MAFVDLPVHLEPLIEPVVYKNNKRSRVKFSIIYITILLVFLLVLILSFTFIFGKKKQPILAPNSTIVHTSPPRSTTNPTTIGMSSTKATTTIEPSSIKATTTIELLPTKTTATSATSANGVTASSAASEFKPSGCPLPLIPKYNPDKKTVVAGSESSGTSLYELYKPIAMALDSESNLFVADSGNFRVLKYTPKSKQGERILGHGTDRFPRATEIIGLLVDKNDLLYSCQQDRGSASQLIIWPSSSKNGTVIVTGFGYVAGLAIDRDLNIYMAWGVNVQIYLAPRYKESRYKRVFGEPNISGMLPIGASSIYVDANNNLFAIDTYNHRIQKTPPDDKYSETIVQKSPLLSAFVCDCHNNLYTIDSDSSLIIYNSTGNIISTMQNALDNPDDSDSRSHTHIGGQATYITDNFASLVLDSKTGDLYVIMYGYDRVTKYILN